MKKPLRFYRDCVNWPRDDVNSDGGLCDMVNAATSVTRRTFLKHVHRDDMRYLEKALGYGTAQSGELTMTRDYHVSYHRSKLHGQWVYYFKHSGIEHVFIESAKALPYVPIYLARGIA